MQTLRRQTDGRYYRIAELPCTRPYLDLNTVSATDCEMIRPPPLMWSGDGSYPGDGGVV